MVSRTTVTGVLVTWWMMSTAVAQTNPAEATVALGDAVAVEPGATCLQQARLIKQVAVWLGRDRVRPGIRVVVRGDEDDRRRVLFDMTHGGPVHRRVFEALPDICGDAHAVLSLAIALAIDAEVQAEWSSTPATAHDPATLVHAQLVGAFEVLPGLAPGIDIGVHTDLTSWLQIRADVLAMHSPNNAIARSQGTFDATWVGGSVQACAGGVVESVVRVGLCVGLAAAGVHGAGDGYAPNHSDTAPWFGTRTGVQLAVRAGPWWLLNLDVLSTFTAPSFQATAADGTVRSRSPSSAGMMLSFGPALDL